MFREPLPAQILLKLREKRLELEARKPKWSPPPFGELLSMFYAAVDADDPELMAEFREACKVAKRKELAERRAWEALGAEYRKAEREAKAAGVAFDKAAWDAKWAAAERDGPL